jgi:cobalt-zinc-cadmium efflux system outer membrane protein
VLTLQDAIALALVKNPDLQAYAWELRAAEARTLQAGVFRNPDLGVVVEDVLGSGEFRDARSAQTTVQLSQAIELGAKRQRRVEASSAHAERVERDYERRRLEVLADVTNKLIHVAADQEELSLSREGTRLARETLATVLERVLTGRASLLEEKKARVAVARAQIVEEHNEHELASARHRLAALWGAPAPGFERVAVDLERRRPVPSYEDLVQRIDSSPEVLTWVTEERLRAAERRLAEARRVPDLMLGAGIRRHEASDDEALVFAVSLPLPIFDRQQGSVAESLALESRAAAGRTAAEARLRSIIFGLRQELQHAVTELEIVESEALPRAEEALQLCREGFEQGRFSYLELVDAERVFLEVKGERIAALSRYHELVLELERLLGQPLEPDVP